MSARKLKLLLAIFYGASTYCAADEILDGRIVGGENAEAGEFPFFVQWMGCGASLVWEDILLTAAHVSSEMHH